jgi:hypothetical protein
VQTQQPKKKVSAKNALLLLTLFVCLNLLIVNASCRDITVPKRTVYFPSKNGSYIKFDTSLLPATFTTLYRDTNTRWYFNDTWITTTTDLTVNAFHSSGWLNYSVSSSGTQEINYATKPNTVYIDGSITGEGAGWSYSGNTVTVTTATSSVKLYYYVVQHIVQVRDADGTNIPRQVTFKGTHGNGTSYTENSNTNGYKALDTCLGNHVVNVWWGDVLIGTSTVSLAGNASTNINTKVRRLTDDSYYVLASLNNTELPAITYVSVTRIKLSSVTASGTLNFKIDSNNWKETGQPYSVTVGTFVYYQTSNTWTWDSTNHVLTLDCTFSSVDITVDWTAPSTGDSSGGVSPPPSGPSIPAIPPPTENVTAPTVPSLPYVPTTPPSPTPTLDLTALGIAIIVITVIVGTSWDYIKKYSSNASLWNSRNTRKKKKVKWRKRT